MPLQWPARLLPATSWCKLVKCADLTARTALFTRGRNTQTLKSKTTPGGAVYPGPSRFYPIPTSNEAITISLNDSRFQYRRHLAPSIARPSSYVSVIK